MASTSRRLWVLLIIAGGGLSCGFPDAGRFLDVALPLDLADASLTISRHAEADVATVRATITQGSAGLVVLDEGQSVLVNDEALTGPDGDGAYGAAIAAQSRYTITVLEPTRGVQETVIDEPGDFEITAPAQDADASLSGFTVVWSNVDAQWDVRIDLAQNILGLEKERRIGPFTDTGSRRLSIEDLSDFQQGAPLTILVTKIDERDGINGFRTAALSTELTQTLTVSPGP